MEDEHAGKPAGLATLVLLPAASRMEAQVLALRSSRKLGPARIGPLVGLAPSTVHAVLTRHGMHRLAWLDRPTGELIRRYERDRPGELVHVDVKKLGAIRDGGGWRAHGRGSAQSNHSRDEQLAGRRVGYDFVHCAIDDHTRLAYAEIHRDETATTCADFLRAAAAFFATVGITRIERVMTDNAMAYRKSHAWRQALLDLGAEPRFTHSYRPQTNGKAEGAVPIDIDVDDKRQTAPVRERLVAMVAREQEGEGE